MISIFALGSDLLEIEVIRSALSEERKLDCRMFSKYEWYDYAGYLHKTEIKNSIIIMVVK
ncbi:hypothetical protein R2TS_34110 [Enterobacter asburiae]|nr:hypothetical protein R2TS_34110 [Enterobacter asburiae]